MGTQKRQTRGDFIKRAVLSTLATAGILSIGAIAPNAIQLLAPFVKKKGTKSSVNNAIHRLSRQGLIVFEKTEKGKFVRLTPKGKVYLATRISQPGKPKQWDKKWRILIFDIKEYRRKTRDRLRRSLTTFGFRHLQHSVWVYPYDCEELIVLLKADFKIGKDVLYIVAEKLENDLWLRKTFKL